MHSLFCLATLLTTAIATAQTADRIAFQTFRDGNWEIYLMDTAGGAPINLTNAPSWEMRPAFSPDGRRIAFESNRSGQFELYALDIASVLAIRLDKASTWHKPKTGIRRR